VPSYVSLPGPSPLWKWLSVVPPFPKQLAWCHTTDAFRLRKIVTEGRFVPVHCAVFGEDLLYFFYGRPAFRRNESDQLRLSSKSPVVVVLSPDLIGGARRVFPFDTGAFDRLYRKWMHAGMKLPDFELACTTDAPQRSVAAFFGTNEKYLQVQASRPSRAYDGEFEVESLVELLNDPDASTADDRRLATELQVGSAVPFDSSSVIAIIMPDELQQAPWMDAFLKGSGSGIEVVPYQTVLLRNAGHYQALLETEASAFQRKRGFV